VCRCVRGGDGGGVGCALGLEYSGVCVWEEGAVCASVCGVCVLGVGGGGHGKEYSGGAQGAAVGRDVVERLVAVAMNDVSSRLYVLAASH
jgi:hypothetical protein